MLHSATTTYKQIMKTRGICFGLEMWILFVIHDCEFSFFGLLSSKQFEEVTIDLREIKKYSIQFWTFFLDIWMDGGMDGHFWTQLLIDYP